MKRIFILFTTVFLITLTGCDKNPATPVGSDAPQNSAQLLDSPAIAKTTSKKIPTKIELQGKIVFADGTTFESAEKKEFALPERLWARISESDNIEALPPGDHVFYTINYSPNGFSFSGTISFYIWNYPVSNQHDIWDHFLWIDVEYIHNTTSFNATHYVYDWGLSSTSYGSWNAPNLPGLYQTQSTRFYYQFGYGNIYSLRATLNSTGITSMYLESLRGRLIGSKEIF